MDVQWPGGVLWEEDGSVSNLVSSLPPFIAIK